MGSVTIETKAYHLHLLHFFYISELKLLRLPLFFFYFFLILIHVGVQPLLSTFKYIIPIYLIFNLLYLFEAKKKTTHTDFDIV